MKRSFTFLICLPLLLLLQLHAYAQPGTTAAEKTLLWKISSKEMKQPSYLFGTIHLICHDDYVWTPAMKRSLDACKEVCFEMDLDEPSLMMEVATGMMDKNGKTLKEYFSEADYAKLEKYVHDSLGMDLEVFQPMKPIALLTLFSTKGASCDTPESYEANIMQEAQKTNKNITGLESVSEQLDLFDNLPVDSVIKDIMEAVNGIEEDPHSFEALIKAYKKQDLPALHKLIQESGKKDIDLSGFLDMRNEKWVPRMIEKMDTNAVFFAVGAGHLPGEMGIISLLRKAGYTVTPVKK